MSIIFDLDGTIIDSKLRLYSLFQHLVISSKLTFDQYWQLKHCRYSNKDILIKEYGYLAGEVERFENAWMELIETPEYLSLDSNFIGVHSALQKIASKTELHLCTARQLREPVLEQLERLGLAEYFSSIMVTEQKVSKDYLISTNVKGLSVDDWVVGDTGKDIQVGMALGIKTCAVSSGFMSRESLLEYKPTLMLDSVAEFSI